MDDDLKKSILKTGTTILGIVCKDGVVMASDNRVSIGQGLIISKNMEKVFPLNEYLLIAGCGSATEFQKVSKILTAELKLKQLRSKSRPTVQQSASLLSNVQVTQSAFILGGLDENGVVSLYEITGGFLNKVEEYTASVGSGMPYVLGLLERQYKKDLSVKEGIELAIEAIKSSTQRDSASGNGLEVYTITKEGMKKAISQKITSTFENK